MRSRVLFAPWPVGSPPQAPSKLHHVPSFVKGEDPKRTELFLRLPTTGISAIKAIFLKGLT